MYGSICISMMFMLLLVLNSPHLPQTAENAPEENHYKVEEVKFQSGKVTLTGTLTIPFTDGKHPAIVLSAGSDAGSRNYNKCGFDLFRKAADYFTRQGFEVLRFDLRGTGSSGGAGETPTAAEMASDLAAAVNFLRKRPEVDARFTGLCGHGDGAAAAAIAASSSNNVSFLVMMNGTVLKSHKSADPALRYNLKYDPSKALAKVKCSVLAAFGGKDLRVPAAENSAALKRIFNGSGHKAWEIKVFNEANHIMQRSAQGSPDEYGNLPKEYAPGYLEYISEWISDLIPREGRR